MKIGRPRQYATDEDKLKARRRRRISAAGEKLAAHAATKPGGIELAAIRPNAGLRADYHKKLDRAVEDMHRSVLYWLRAAYRANAPEIAQDASPARILRSAMRKLGRRWLRRFDELGPELAEYFATAASERVDGALADMLRKKGFTVRFKATAAQNDAYQAIIGQNVGLIKSVAQKYLTDIEGDVMRSVMAGRDLGTLTKTLEKTFGVTRRRAALIARSQNNMATATLTKVRQRELGIKQAKWLHSSGGKTPRPEHVAFSGKLYDVTKGAFLEGKWTWPGVEINCRCVSVPIIPGFAA
jgi:SPP1 gp7 family putative phage head morphogenesis protein